MEMNASGGAGTGASYFLGQRGIFRGVDPVKNRAPLEATKYKFNSGDILFALSIRRPLTGRVRKSVYI